MSKYQISCSLFFPLFLLILLEEADDKEDDTEEEGDEEDDEMEVEARGSEAEESWKCVGDQKVVFVGRMFPWVY